MIAREIVTRLRYMVEASGMRKYIAQGQQIVATARAQMGSLGAANVAASNKTGASLQQMASGAATAHARAAERVGAAWSGAGNLIRGALAGISAASAAKIADEWAGVEGRVGLVTDGLAEQKMVLGELYDLAQRNGQAYAAVGGLFQSVARNKNELGLDTGQVLALTDVIGKAMTVGGGDASSQQAALMQLGQALGTGVLRGEELNSVMEQAPRLAKAIAEAFGVPVGQLKKLGEQGKLDAKILATGLIAQAEKLQAEFDRMPMTFSRSWTMVTNRLGKAIDSWNKQTKAAEKFNKVANYLIDHFDKIVHAIALVGASVGIVKLLGWLRAATSANKGLIGSLRVLAVALAPFLKWMIILEGIDLLVEDITNWFAGIPSVTGDLLGPVTQWGDKIAIAEGWLRSVADWLGISWDKVKELGPALAILAAPVAAIGLLLAPIVTTLAGVVALTGGWGVAIAAAAAVIGGVLITNWDAVTAAFKSTMSWFTSAWDGVRSKATGVIDAISTKWRAAKSFFGFAEPAEPLATKFGLTLPKVPETAMQSGKAGGASGGWGSPNVTVQTNITTRDNPQAIAAATSGATKRALDSSLSRAFPYSEAAP